MLVLSRYMNEAVVLDLRAVGLGMVRVVVAGRKGKQVVLGFEADTRIPIMREELLGDGGDASEEGGEK